MSTKDVVLAKLEENNGNIKATARDLALSEERVRQLSLTAKPPAPIVTPVTPTQTLATLNETKCDPEWVVPHAAPRVAQLRNSILNDLQTAIELGALPLTQQIRVLRILMEFETAQRAIAKPLSPVIYDQRRTENYTLNNIVNALSGAALSQSALRALAAGPTPAPTGATGSEKLSPCEPDVIEGEIC